MKISKYKYSLPVLMLLTSLEATSIKDVVEHTVQNNEDIISKSLNNKAFRKYIDEQKGGYYPKLDLTAYLEKKKTVEDSNNSTITNDADQNGSNIQLDFEQLIYDGNLTPSKVKEAKASYKSNKFKNSNDVETILLDSINSYLEMLQYDERVANSEANLKVHESYLSIAKETEAINGEILDKVQTKAKIHSAKSNLFNEMNNKNSAKSAFNKNVGMTLSGGICRPALDESKIPATFDELQKKALTTNYAILEQIANIKEQKAIVSQENSNFLPTLKFKLQGIYDKDLIDQENLDTSIYSGKLELKYNLFNGLSDKRRSQREELFLKEAQLKLDTITKSVVDDLSVSYETYQTAKKQIAELKQFIEENKTIIEIYNDQFDAGTRNFIDVLNVEADLYNSKTNLINTEFAMYKAYYEILKNTSSLQTTIENSNVGTCSNETSDIAEVLKTVQEEETMNDVLSEETEEITTPLQAVESSAMNPKNEYALFVETYKSEASAQNVLASLSSSLENNMKTKIVSNTNGTYTVAIYNIEGSSQAISIKNKLNSKYPGSYYIKKK
ncbi:hypothetical protein LPB137_10325 [Poseidonibacter parvus]|uniref:SPOR domain-containing protein n=1 Tax=Poseidonibacter parvus TaxID=1850254 RepID=A0A1P8KNT5_9BACT|nr:TolC family protein [Poseidonibacter parvus]APW66211.1 hypothetical protein LPB137_10325 [Poseidonibacter parvus]